MLTATVTMIADSGKTNPQPITIECETVVPLNTFVAFRKVRHKHEDILLNSDRVLSIGIVHAPD